MVNMREIAEEYRLGHWTQVMQERSASGMSIKAFCESEGIHPNRYFYWQRKLRESAPTATAAQSENTTMIAGNPGVPAPPATVPQGPVVPHSRNCSPMPPGWTLCEAKKPEPEQNTVPFTSLTTVQIEIGKSRITAHASTDQELLAKVCRTLMSLC